MFWKRERGNFKNDLITLRNGIQTVIRRCQFDLLTDPKNAHAYEHMIRACYKALDCLQKENISGVIGANNCLQLGRLRNFDHLEGVYRFSLNMDNNYYDDYYEDYRYRR